LLSNILKNNLVVSVFIVFLLALAGFIIAMGHAAFTLPKDTAGVIYAGIFQNSQNALLLKIISFAALTGGAFLFNFILNNNETLSRTSFFPAFIYTLISFEAFSAYDFHPSFAANILIMLGMMRMTQSYRVSDAKSMFFDGAFMISAASFVYWPSITLIPMIFISLLILRPFVWREWAMALMGIFAPHFIAASIMYILGRLDRYYNEGMFAGFSFASFQPTYGAQYFVLVCMGFLFLLLIFNRLSKGGASRKIRQQKNINLLSFWILFGAGGIFYEVPFRTSIPLLCVPPIAGLLSEWLGNFRKGTLSDFALLLLITAFTLSVMQIQGVF
jgi:hypothetical protein